MEESVCSFINNLHTDSGETLTVCGAHYNRLVLGEKKLQKVCETPAHFDCEFFNSPKGN